jgi:hypothetical protein
LGDTNGDGLGEMLVAVSYHGRSPGAYTGDAQSSLEGADGSGGSYPKSGGSTVPESLLHLIRRPRRRSTRTGSRSYSAAGAASRTVGYAKKIVLYKNQGNFHFTQVAHLDHRADRSRTSSRPTPSRC